MSVRDFAVYEMTNDLQLRGLQRGVRSSLVPARKPSTRPGWYCILRSRVLARAVSWAMSRLARLARERFRWDQTDSTGLSSEGIGGELEDRQPVPGRDQLAHRPADVRVQVVPDQDDRPAELLAGGVQQPGVVRLGEALALVAAPAAGVDAVDQPGLLPGLHRDQRGQRHSLVAAAGHRHHRGLAAAAPGAALRRP